MSEVNIFVNREKELQQLDNYFKQCRYKGVNCGILIYGWRRVGKTTLLREFVRRNGGYLIESSWISDPRSFLIYVLKLTGKTKESTYLLSSAFSSDLTMVFRSGMDILCSSNTSNIIILDEFHILLDKLSYRIARETGKRKDIVLNDLAWLIREFVESKKCFIILATSMGWAKIKELYFPEKKEASPLMGVLIKMEIKPLDEKASKNLAKKLNPVVDENMANKIYRITGGIPRIIEIIAPNIREETNITKLIYNLTQQGQFDEFFENIIRFVAETTKRDYSIYLEILKTMEDKETSPDLIGKTINIDRVSAYNVLEELRKMEIIEKKKERGRVKYKLKYPLLSLWLQTKITPRKKITEILASGIGIMAESYVRELLREYQMKNKPLEIYDDKKGTYLAGTAEEIKIEIEKIYTKKEMEKRLKGIDNGDIIIMDKNNKEFIVEIKATLKDITVETVEKINKVATAANIENKIIMQLGPGGVEPKAIGKASKTNTLIITKEGIKLLAKKIGYMQY